MSVVVNHISKKFGNQLALNDVSFSIKAGEVVGLLGANGAGKSTLMKIITGYLPPDGGYALVGNLPVATNKTDFRKRIGYLPENTPLYHEMYVREYLLMVAGMYRLKHRKNRAEEVIEMTGLKPEVTKRIGALSKGYRQRVGLAQALIHDPEVLILDEPTSGLDPNQLDEIRNLIINLSEKKTVILSTHIMQEVEAVCNRVMIIRTGEMVADGPVEQIKKLTKQKQQTVKLTISEAVNMNQLNELSFIADVSLIGENEYLIMASAGEDDVRPKIFEAAVKNSWTIISMQEESQSVESAFRDLTK